MAEAEAEARAGSARHQCPPDTGLAGALPVGTEVTTVAAPDDVPPAKPIPRTARAWPLRAPAITEFRWLRAPAVTRHLVPYARLAPLAFLMVAFTVRFATASVDTLRSFQQDAYDLALYDQGIWLLSRFHAPFMTVMGTDMFAAHTVFIFVLLVPLYWIYPHTAALLVVQAMALASGAVPVYLLGRRLLSSRTLSTLLAAAYLLNPAIQQANLDQFHVEAFEAPILAFCVYAAVVWRPRLLFAMVALLLLCKQDDALFAVPLGLWVTFRRDRTAGLAIVGSAVTVALIENLVIIPVLLNGVPLTYTRWWPFGSLSATVRVLIRKPGEFLDFLVSSGRPFYLWQMAFGTGLAFLAAPGVLAVALPELLADAFSSNPYLHQIFRHYSVPTSAVLLCATVVGIARARRRRERVIATVTVTLCALWACVLWGDAPFSNNPYVPPNPSAPSVVATDHLLSKLPPRAVVSAAQNFVPNIDHRRQVYLFPTPFSQSYYGNPKFNGTELPFASKVEYLLLPRCISCDGNLGESAQVVFDRIAPEFRVVGSTGNVVLYERKYPAPTAGRSR
ncbi:MAG: DUF2079 domain-containing protein [Actinomycetota bacterium]|nr:DUF2079 domain-containing protein [Actinomycetota bacterium]